MGSDAGVLMVLISRSSGVEEFCKKKVLFVKA